MATVRLPILGPFTVPDASGEVFFQPADILLTTAPWKRLIPTFIFGTSKSGLEGSFAVPQDYTDTANVVIVWTTSATSNDVEWDFDYTAVGGNDIESLNTATVQETVGSEDTAPNVAFERMELSIALTDGNFAVGDNVNFRLFRDQSDAGDSLTVDVVLIDLFFEYADA